MLSHCCCLHSLETLQSTLPCQVHVLCFPLVAAKLFALCRSNASMGCASGCSAVAGVTAHQLQCAQQKMQSSVNQGLTAVLAPLSACKIIKVDGKPLHRHVQFFFLVVQDCKLIYDPSKFCVTVIVKDGTECKRQGTTATPVVTIHGTEAKRQGKTAE